MKILKGNYSMSAICKLLGETRSTLRANKDAFFRTL